MHVDGQIAQVDVDPIPAGLDLGHCVHEPREPLEKTVDTFLVCVERLDRRREWLNVLVEGRLGLVDEIACRAVE